MRPIPLAHHTGRPFCWSCHRTPQACFCAKAIPFQYAADFAIVVHPREAASTVGTAWILRKSIANLTWFRSTGEDLDTDSRFLKMISSPEIVPLLLFPSAGAINLDLCPQEEWDRTIPAGRRPLFLVVDGTWTEAGAILRKSQILKNMRRVSFQDTTLSEYEFKKQPHPSCLSCVEGVHRVIEKMAARGWAALPEARAHDRMIDIFRGMVQYQLHQERNPRTDRRIRGIR